jgi:hypothetical protein
MILFRGIELHPPSLEVGAQSNSMDEVQAGDQIIRCDRDRTRAAYSALLTGDAERCGCLYCLNFAAQRSSAYPIDFGLLLERIGIDVEKEGEVYEIGLQGDLRTYCGWFYFSGYLTEPGERMTELPGFQYYFRDAVQLPRPDADFGERAAAVEFETRLPWVLKDRPEPVCCCSHPALVGRTFVSWWVVCATLQTFMMVASFP